MRADVEFMNYSSIESFLAGFDFLHFIYVCVCVCVFEKKKGGGVSDYRSKTVFISVTVLK